MSEGNITHTDETAKDRSQLRQKRMIADHFEKLARARGDGKKVVYTFVPGNLTELITALDMLPVLPEMVEPLPVGPSVRLLLALRHW